ncbi:phospholipase A and acyltransferase 5-like [Argopecten irradians]|uniref:phospholipase A and acyltransferase 5-like n=1 Tax=Argopecten irradians TaxID=31199 RepID=UPI003715A52A
MASAYVSPRRVEKFLEGDLIEFPRLFYNHYGVYLGNDIIIHITPCDDEDRSDSRFFRSKFCGITLFKPKVCVKIEPISNVENSCQARRNNEMDRCYKPLDPSKMKEKAETMVGAYDYNLFTNNCKHFAVNVRYGVKRSKQIEKNNNYY